jgi:molybdopterin-containing oxidoreductase family iron-sulfur binding subunit
MTDNHANQPPRSRRLNVLGQSPRVTEARRRSRDVEFEHGADELVIPPASQGGGTTRRLFMGILGTTGALAGTGCIRKDVQHIVPYAKRPEDSIPGTPVYYATAIAHGTTVQGLLVECHDGRPTKVEGNPNHAHSGGRTDAVAQAELFTVYDPDRSAAPHTSTWERHGKAPQGTPDAEARTMVIDALCEGVRERVLEETNSVDAADAAAAQCKADAEAGGKHTYSADTGVVTMQLPGQTATKTSWEMAWRQFDAAIAAKISAGGAKLAIVARETMSPSERALLADIKRRLGGTRIFRDDPLAPENTIAAAELLAGKGTRISYSLRGAKTIFAVDADFLGTGQDHVRLTAEWANGRDAPNPRRARQSMNRLYSVEPHLTQTGAAADHRVAMAASEVGRFLQLVAIKLTQSGKTIAANDQQKAVLTALKAPGEGSYPESWEAFASALVQDLEAGTSVVVVGERQPPAVHGLGALINSLLGAVSTDGNQGKMFFRANAGFEYEPLSALASALSSSAVDTVICLGTNPVYDGAGSLRLGELLAGANVIHFGGYRDETGRAANLHMPLAHPFESWSDLSSLDGETSIVQPLIAPLYDAPTTTQVLARVLAPGEAKSALDIVREQWAPRVRDDKTWNEWLHKGEVPKSGPAPVVQPNGWAALAGLIGSIPVPGKGMEVNFHVSPKLLDGTLSNNGWMQEVPHPLTKLTWDNAALVSQSTADALGVANGDNIAIKLGDRSIAMPIWVAPGQAHNTVSVAFGYGRRGAGGVAEGAGFDVYKLRNHESPWYEWGNVSRGAGSYELASTQDWGTQDPDGPEGSSLMNYEPRTLFRETTVRGFREDPNFAKRGDLMPPERLHALWEEPELVGPHQWGMTVDLNRCTSCNTCTVACQVENNIPVVGKAQVANGREMHWMRIDRYYQGDDINNGEAVFMPVGCQHCETAPCENVCPVQATSHSPEGLNDMTYNRCIGTRYCSNNCPYKVRRFNFFNFNLDIDPVEQMVKNPDVTVRFRGVIEKCSYCVQRINQAKIDSHVAGSDEKLSDGSVIVACQQACPAGAIEFGDISDEKSKVSLLKKSKRNYALLQDLYTKPRTTYLGRVRNPHPSLEPKKAATKGEG